MIMKTIFIYKGQHKKGIQSPLFPNNTSKLNDFADNNFEFDEDGRKFF